MSECNHDCASCGENCGERGQAQDLHEAPNELSHIKKVIGVVSGKGGVGKSLVASLLACAAAKGGKATAILDADITGPSIPRAFGLTDPAENSELGIFPAKSAGGVEVMSLNLLLPNDTDPVVWRGPMIAGAVKQFWTDVVWGDVDYMFIDMPPGTGDVPLTVFQTVPLDGVVVVTTPQELVGMIVEKACRMAELMKIPVLALVENMSYAVCPECGKPFELFGKSRVEATAKRLGIPLWARLPLDPGLAEACDTGRIEQVENGAAAELSDLFGKIAARI